MIVTTRMPKLCGYCDVIFAHRKKKELQNCVKHIKNVWISWFKANGAKWIDHKVHTATAFMENYGKPGN